MRSSEITEKDPLFSSPSTRTLSGSADRSSFVLEVKEMAVARPGYFNSIFR